MDRVHLVERRDLRVGNNHHRQPVDVLATQTSIACVYVADAEKAPSLMFGTKGGARINLVMFDASKMTPEEIFLAQSGLDWNVMVSLVNSPDEACEFIISLSQACQDEGRKANAVEMIERAHVAAFHLEAEAGELRSASFEVGTKLGEVFLRRTTSTSEAAGRRNLLPLLRRHDERVPVTAEDEDSRILLESFGSLQHLARFATSPEEVMKRTPLSDENSRRTYLLLNGGGEGHNLHHHQQQ